MTNPFCIGMLGGGFMGRTHSNACGQVGHFFDREHQPVLKACYSREEDREELEAFAERWSYEHTFINSFADFLASLEGGEPFMPDMKCALRTQKVCEAVFDSANQGVWVEI